MKRLMLSTLLMITPFFTFAADDVFTSERWKEVKVNDPYFANLDQMCSEKFPSSRSANLYDIMSFSEKFQKEAARPRLYTFLRETFGFADSSDPKIQSALELNGKHRTIALPFYFSEPGSFYNPTALFHIGSDENEGLTVSAVLADATGSRASLISLAPSLGEAKVFCIVGTENS
ncbi:hypothetical protein DDN98_04075 [Vibrio cholerae]|uniref:hypothetical protein n=1 Tax=Vibrio cholerae TaxID=666 RepID=UPI0018F076D5|nr:hypothetical protein [Vibrio cholerae]EGR4292964.1 hypothetical protein [Vibrio cholerae]EGR4296839.1 hypothetical protein [Vibrio cholerae]MBJ6970332.1 hypothetical protein [Vibrio cholerae]